MAGFSYQNVTYIMIENNEDEYDNKERFFQITLLLCDKIGI